MIEISLNKLEKSYGFKKVLDEFSLDIKTGEIITLVGENGAGKSTILNIINGDENLDKGNVSIRRGNTIGYLKQIPEKRNENDTVKEVLYESVSDILSIGNKLKEYEQMMETVKTEKINEIMIKYSNLQEKFINIGGYDVDTQVNKIITGFKLNNLIEKKYNSLSGGEKSIVLLAAIMIKKPSILLLDEPTNHLDIDTLEWFERFLLSYKGTIIISSHDRYFLDKVATKTILIDKGKADIYHGNYSYFLEESDRRALAEFDDYKTQQKQIEAMKAAIKKLKEWGEKGDNPRFFKRAACIERKLEKIELLDRPELKKQLPLDFEINGRSGKDVLVALNLSIMIGNKVILDGANMHLKYGEKVCLMGKNGTGKSTFIKTILGDNNICQGEIKIGSNVSIGYIPQEIIFEDDEATVLETARKFYDGTETLLRASLAKFLFYGENVFKRVGKLSGGEKVRLKLFELIQKKANLLILDEPTNHIDIDTKEMLEEALADYQGTLLFISHDRYFINKLAQRVINIENQTFNEYLGNYDYFKEKNKKS